MGSSVGATQDACAVMSLTRAAGMLPMITVAEPWTICPGPAGTQGMSEHGAVMSMIRAAGWLPISTVGSPFTIVSGMGG